MGTSDDAPREDTGTEQPLPLLRDRYRLRKRIGFGGMGAVYLAHDELLDRTVAVKELRHEYAKDEVLRKRFVREARAAGGLSHPHVVGVFDLIDEARTLFIVMEYLDGGTLLDAMNAAPERRLEVPFTVAVGRDSCLGLEAAHEAGLVHRDIKPGNILFDGKGRAKIGDFGVVRARNDQDMTALTSGGGHPGTLVYMAPEQIDGAEVEGRSDVYSLAAVLYEALAGTRYFERPGVRRSERALMDAICDAPPVPLRERAPWVPIEVEAMIERALAKDHADRPTAGELSEQLGSWLRSPRPRPSIVAPTGDTRRITAAKPAAGDDARTQLAARARGPGPALPPLAGFASDPDADTQAAPSGAGRVDHRIEPRVEGPRVRDTSAEPPPTDPPPSGPARSGAFARPAVAEPPTEPPRGLVTDPGASKERAFARAPGEASESKASDASAIRRRLEPKPDGTERTPAEPTAPRARTERRAQPPTQRVVVPGFAAGSTPPGGMSKGAVAAAAAAIARPGDEPTTRAGDLPRGQERRSKDGAIVVRLPAASFVMGGDEASDEVPARRVTVDAFLLDRAPVTVGQYRRFLDALRRDGPPDVPLVRRVFPDGKDHRPTRWDTREYQELCPTPEHPVVLVDWFDAMAYAAWAGARLPSEAEWERAARGGKEPKVFPWGDAPLDASRAVFGRAGRGPEPVGQRPQGDTPEGVADLLGNVWEWCADRYDPRAYATLPEKNPRLDVAVDAATPLARIRAVKRGGSWTNAPHSLRAAKRGFEPPLCRRDNLGFRCAGAPGEPRSWT